MTAVYPGSFDPFTNGHLDIFLRATRLFDHVTIAILNNSGKQSLFSITERIEMLQKLVPDAKVQHFDGLLVNFGFDIIVRGLRSTADYEIEQQMAVLNRQLRPTLDTVFLLASPIHAAVSSRLVKEIACLGGDISAFVPPSVAERLKQKFAAR